MKRKILGCFIAPLATFLVVMASPVYSDSKHTFYLPITATGTAPGQPEEPTGGTPEEPAWSLDVGVLPPASVNEPYAFNLSDFISPSGLSGFSWAASDLPIWATLNAQTGALSGTPDSADPGTEFTALASRDYVNDHKTYTLIVNSSSLEVSNVAVAPAHVCAITKDNDVLCWGNAYGWSDSDSQRYSTPQPIVGFNKKARYIAADKEVTCMITLDGELWCAGRSAKMNSSSNDLQKVNGLPSDLKSVSVIEGAGCATTYSNELYCFGSNFFGVTTSTSPTGYEVRKVDLENVTKVSLRNSAACAVASSEVYCWGSNSFRIVSMSNIMNSLVPVHSASLSGADDVILGYQHACALINGLVKCWGSNAFEKLGGPTDESHSAPVTVNGASSGIKSLAVADNSSCAIRSDDSVYCWGLNKQDSIGDPPLGQRHNIISGFTNVPLTLKGKGNITCASTSAGQLECWGSNDSYQLGRTSPFSSPTPFIIEGIAQ